MGANAYNCLVATWVPVLGCVGSTSGALHVSGGLFLFFNRTLPEVRRGHQECVTGLIQANADVNVGDDGGLTPLHYAVKQNENLMSKKRPHYFWKGLHFDWK